jgi:hypothetical protein
MSREEKFMLAQAVLLLACGIPTSIMLGRADHPWLGATAAIAVGVVIVAVALRLRLLGERARAREALRRQHPSRPPEGL